MKDIPQGFMESTAKHRLSLEDLIRKGYLPKELPPPINTVALSVNAKQLINELTGVHNNASGKSKKSSKPTTFSIPTRNNGRRILEIPNPLHQIQLCNTITNNWERISKFADSSLVSQSRLEVVKNSERAVEPIADSYELWREVRKARIEASINARYVLKADITNFYESIYTHSIPWALDSKTVAKNKRKRSDLLGNELDDDLQRCQDGQTSGIPVGPDTSRVISEIIVTAIDQALVNKIGRLQGIRFYDDYYLYFPTLAELEEAYSVLQSTLSEYELTLNLSKVEKLDIADEIFDKPWVNQLRRYKIRNTHSTAQYNDLIYYFDLVAHLAKEFSADSVYFYALKRISKECILRGNWEMLEPLLLRTLQISARPIHVILSMFLQNQNERINKDRVQGALGYFIFQHAKLKNAFEVSWGLWFLKSLGIKLPELCAKHVAAFDHPVVALIALDMENLGLTEGALDKNIWQQSLNTAALYESNWLLAYEANVKGWLAPNVSNDFIKEDPFFLNLRNKNISFYDSNRQIPFIGK